MKLATHRLPMLLALACAVLAPAACAEPGRPQAAAAGPVAGAAPSQVAGGVAPPEPEEPQEPQEPEFDRTAHSTSKASSPWVVVNKTHPLPETYRPELVIVEGYQVAPPAAAPLKRLLGAAARDGVDFKIASAFRSYAHQRQVYRGQVRGAGRAAADRVSARPGHSEHQTGLAVDLVTPDDPGCELKTCFADLAGGTWIAEHAWRYGFVVRYPERAERITGYRFEPWHIRFVGADLARELHENPRTLEEFFDIEGGDYE